MSLGVLFLPLRPRKGIRERLGSRERKAKRETRETRATVALKATKAIRAIEAIEARPGRRVFPALSAKLVSRVREDQTALLDRLALLDATARAVRTEGRDAFPSIEYRTEPSPLRSAPVNTEAGYASLRRTSISAGVEVGMEAKGRKESKAHKARKAFREYKVQPEQTEQTAQTAQTQLSQARKAFREYKVQPDKTEPPAPRGRRASKGHRGLQQCLV
jgi:hypothetical protein